MNAKPHRTNSDFQLRYFIAGSCRTPDGAWCLLYNQRLDMESKLRHAEANEKRGAAKIARALHVIGTSELRHEILEAEADLMEQQADEAVHRMNVEGARSELETIKSLMEEIKPACKYAHLPILEAAELMQREEWCEELRTRAENFMITQGTIPHDHLETMRMHPDFKTHLAPYVQYLITTMAQTDRAKTLNLVDALSVPTLPYEGPRPIPEPRLNYGR